MHNIRPATHDLTSVFRTSIPEQATNTDQLMRIVK